jgi:hypothetical protein
LLSAYAPVAEAQPLDLELGFVPLPAPLPLIPAEPPVLTVAGAVAPAVTDDVPKPRVLMTKEPGNSAFLTQLYGQN